MLHELGHALDQLKVALFFSGLSEKLRAHLTLLKTRNHGSQASHLTPLDHRPFTFSRPHCRPCSTSRPTCRRARPSCPAPQHRTPLSSSLCPCPSSMRSCGSNRQQSGRPGHQPALVRLGARAQRERARRVDPARQHWAPLLRFPCWAKPAKGSGPVRPRACLGQRQDTCGAAGAVFLGAAGQPLCAGAARRLGRPGASAGHRRRRCRRRGPGDADARVGPAADALWPERAWPPRTWPQSWRLRSRPSGGPAACGSDLRGRADLDIREPGPGASRHRPPQASQLGTLSTMIQARTRSRGGPRPQATAMPRIRSKVGPSGRQSWLEPARARTQPSGGGKAGLVILPGSPERWVSGSCTRS